MKKRYYFLIIVGIILVLYIGLRILIYKNLDLVNADDILFLTIETDKEVYTNGEPIKVDIKGYLGKNEDYIVISGCGIGIYEQSSLNDDTKPYPLISGFGECDEYSELFSQFRLKEIPNKIITLNQNNCPFTSNDKLIPGKYSIEFGCNYQNLKGSSWEGVYHGGIDSNMINITIISNNS